MISRTRAALATVNVHCAAVHHVCLHSLPDALFSPSPSPRRADDKGNIMRSICSVSGNTLIFQPAWSFFPSLHIRSDVIIGSNVIDDAIDAFSLAILRDCRSVKSMPLNTWIGIKILSPSGDASSTHLSSMTAFQVEAETSKFMQTVRKAVLSSQVL